MNLHPMSCQHTRRRRSVFAILRTLALGAGFAVLVGATPAADPAPPASAAPGLSDMVLARTVLAALDADAGLKSVNLVVSVVDGVAVIGGPVPSAAVAKKAEQVVRRVEGVKDVRNTCFVSGGPDPLMKAVADKAGSTLPPRPVMADLPGVLTNHLAPVSPFQPNTGVAANDLGSNERVALRPSLPLAGAANVLGAPVGPVGANAAAAVVIPATPQGTLTGGTAGGVLAAVTDVRKTEPRFAALTAELHSGVLVVSGSAPRAADGWDFAQKLRQIPGVSRVAVGSVAEK